MHQSNVTTVPNPRAGWGIAGKKCWVFTFASSQQCRGIVFFLGENTCSGDYSCERGHIAVVLPTVCPHSMGLIAGIFWTKCESPRYSPGVEGGAVVTNNWCINHHEGLYLTSGLGTEYCCRADKNPYRHDSYAWYSYRHNRCVDSNCQ